MLSTPIFNDLLGLTFHEDSNYYYFSKVELPKVGLSTGTTFPNKVIVAIHEMMKRSYVGSFTFDPDNYLIGSEGRILYDYATYYDDIKIVSVGKRWSNPYTIWSYFWHFSQSTPAINEGSINLATPLIVDFPSEVGISKTALGSPIDELEFMTRLFTYLKYGGIEGVRVVQDYRVEILTTQNPILDLDLVSV